MMELSSHLLAVGYATRDGTHSLKYLNDFASLQVEFCEPITLSDLEANLSRQGWAVILYDLAHPAFEYRQIIESVQRLNHQVSVIGLVDAMSMEAAVDVIRLGFCGVVQKQDTQRLLEMVKQEIARQQTPVHAPDSEKRYEDMFRLGLPILVIEPITGEILDANPAAQRFYGYDLDTFRTKTVYDFNLPPAKQTRERLEQPLTGEMETYYFIHRHADGSLRHVEIFSTAMDFNGATKIYSVVTDISARMTAQKALEDMNALLNLRVQERTFELERTRDRLEAIFEHSGDGILLVNIHAEIQQANYAFAQMFGHSAESVSGKNFTTYFDAEDALRVQTCLQEVVTTHEAQRIEVCARHVDGRAVAVEIHIAPVNRSPESVRNLVCMTRDISGRKARERELHYQASLQQNLSDAVIFTDLDYRIQSWNKASERIYGYKAEDVIGQPARDILRVQYAAPDERLRILAPFEQQGWYQDEVTHLHQDGHPLAIMTAATLVKDDNGVPIGVIAINRDISERKRLEEALDRKYAELDRFFNVSADMLDIANTDGVLLKVNGAWEKLLGLPVAEIEGRRFLDFVHPDDIPATLDAMTQLSQQKPVIEFVNRYRSADGSYRLIEWRSILDGNFFYASARDITERKQMEDALRQSEERYRLLTENTKDMIMRLAPDGRRTYVSPAAYALTGYTPQEMMAEPRITITHPDDFLTGAEAFQKAIASGKNYFHVEQRILHKDGHTFWSNLSATLVRDPQTDALVETIVIVQDISERKLIEAALEQSEERYQAFLTKSSEGFGIVAETGRVLEWNEIAAQISGQTSEQVIGQYAWDVHFQATPPQDRSPALYEQIKAGMLHMLRTGLVPGENGELEGIMYRADGVNRVVTSRFFPIIHKADGYVIGSIMRDITERKQLEEALRQSEEQYRLIAENTKDIIIKMAIDGTRTYVSPSVVDQLGYHPDELVGQPAYELVHPEDRAATRTTIQNVLAAGQDNFAIHQRLRHKAGHYIWVETSISVVRNVSTGQRIEMIGIARDITERKQLEDARRQSEELYRLLAENIKDVIVKAQLDGTLTYVSPSSFEAMGYTPEEMMALKSFKIVHPDDIPGSRTVIYEALTSSCNSFTIRQRHRHKDGRYVWHEGHYTILRDAEGKPTGIVGVIRDTTERQQAEEALKQALEKERQLNLLKTRFVSTASHEFRTPLAIILSYTETLLNYRAKMDEQQVTTRLNRIAQQVLFMKGIMEDVLQLARIQTGRFDFRPTKGDLNALCQEIIEDFATQPEHQGRVRARINPTPVRLAFDQRLMRHVLNNLISNALKYSPAEKPIYFDLITESNQVTITIRDEGFGIPPDDLERLFEPFYRAKNVAHIEGTGLGLSITYEAVVLHGGTIKAESTEGVGTTFTVTLPL